ncbi:major royal jelly protein [Colletotrichum simmondsii]|uniref:Major royal jelly protein n=1 Tax=Colletotrichum simmondsii TaxID=703756 RepID=A0A135RZE8_9PEZI|nr:major royal jelly protein [Colletotrichum simmondsii]
MRVCSLTLATLASTAPLVSALAPGLEIALTLDRATEGISISTDGRKFLTQRYSTTDAPQAVELLSNGTTVLYPDSTWNSWTSNSTLDPKKAFVSIDGARIGPDGRFWIVDGGTTDSDRNLVNGSSKLVGINLETNLVDKAYYLDNLTKTGSVIDDVRFNGNYAYLSDTIGALVVMDLTTGQGQRVLVGHSSALAWFPMAYNGSLVPGYQGGTSTLSVGLDQIEVSPDGVYLYYQPCNGGMYRVKTEYVNGALTNSTLAANLGDYVEPFALTPSTGGTTIDGDGNIYVSDTNLLAIWKVKPDGTSSILVQDDALVWTDLMWVDANKTLWLPASQMRPGANGLMADGPHNILTFPIEAGPSLIDHA